MAHTIGAQKLANAPFASRSESRGTRFRHACQKGHDRSLSLIEQLPNELIQRVFFFCCEISLPLASPTLAAQLSGPYVYRKFLERVFCDVINHELAIEFRTEYALNASAQVLARIRVRALSCRWLTWTIFDGHRKRTLDINFLAEQWQVCCHSFRQLYPDLKLKKRHEFQLYIGRDFPTPGKLIRQPMEMDDSQFRFLRAVCQGDGSQQTVNCDHWRMYTLWFSAIRVKNYRLVHLLALNDYPPKTYYIMQKTMEECGHDLLMANLLKCCIFNADWDSMKFVADATKSISVREGVPYEALAFQPLLDVYEKRRNDNNSYTNEFVELLGGLVETSRGDTEWHQDIRKAIRLQQQPLHQYVLLPTLSSPWFKYDMTIGGIRYQFLSADIGYFNFFGS